MEGHAAEWVRDYADDLFSWARHKTGDRESARDLVQETFLAALKSYSGFKGESKVRTWLFSILNHKITDYHRKRFRQAEINASGLDAQGEGKDIMDLCFNEVGHWRPEYNESGLGHAEIHLLDDDAFREVLKKCLDALPATSASAIHLKYMLEKKGSEICQELDLSTTNYWQLIHRAKVQLRVCLEKNWFNS